MKKNQRKRGSATELGSKVPWHVWFMGFFFAFIFLNGVYDYFMMLGHNSDYYNEKGFGEAVHEYFTDYPLVPLVFWTINVFSGAIAPLLLLLRTLWAMRVALIAAVSMFCLQLFTFSLMDRWKVLGPWISIFDISLLILTVAFYYYCRWLGKLGVLK